MNINDFDRSTLQSLRTILKKELCSINDVKPIIKESITHFDSMSNPEDSGTDSHFRALNSQKKWLKQTETEELRLIRITKLIKRLIEESNRPETPCEKLGYRPGDEFVMLGNEKKRLILLHDDGTDMPKFNIFNTETHERWNGYVELNKITYFY